MERVVFLYTKPNASCIALMHRMNHNRTLLIPGFL
jgi:hypothetical protein